MEVLFSFLGCCVAWLVPEDDSHSTFLSCQVPVPAIRKEKGTHHGYWSFLGYPIIHLVFFGP